jgi:hypothetical protein
MSILHVVLFRFPTPLSPEDESTMTAMVEAFPPVIDGLGVCRFGTDITGARTFGFQYLLQSEFDDLESLEAYRVHPSHVAFVEWIGERHCEVLAFDYALSDQTDFSLRS